MACNVALVFISCAITCSAVQLANCLYHVIMVNKDEYIYKGLAQNKILVIAPSLNTNNNLSILHRIVCNSNNCIDIPAHIHCLNLFFLTQYLIRNIQMNSLHICCDKSVHNILCIHRMVLNDQIVKLRYISCVLRFNGNNH